MSGKKCISILMRPSPVQASHRPPRVLKENRPGPYPRLLASGVEANRSRMSLNSPVYVAGLERGVRPMGLWSMLMTLSRYSSPSMRSCLPGRTFTRFRSAPSFLYRISLTREDFPLPDTPVTQVKVPRGMATSTWRRLFSAAPNTFR